MCRYPYGNVKAGKDSVEYAEDVGGDGNVVSGDE